MYPQIKQSNKSFCPSEHTSLDALTPKSQFQNQKLIIRFVVKKRRNRMLSQTKINLISIGCSELYSSPIVSPATSLQPNSNTGLRSSVAALPSHGLSQTQRRLTVSSARYSHASYYNFPPLKFKQINWGPLYSTRLLHVTTLTSQISSQLAISGAPFPGIKPSTGCLAVLKALRHILKKFAAHQFRTVDKYVFRSYTDV